MTLNLDIRIDGFSLREMSYWVGDMAGTGLFTSGLVVTGVAANAVARADAEIEISANVPVFSLFQSRAVGSTADETALVFSGRDAGGTLAKQGSISYKYTSVTADNARSILRLNVTNWTSGVATEAADIRMYGKQGITFFGTSDTTGPGDKSIFIIGTLGVGATPVGYSTTIIGGSQTGASGQASSLMINSTLVAAANVNTLVNVRMTPTFTPGAFTGVLARGVQIDAFSVAAFTSPADVAALDIGVVTGTGATNSACILLGTPTGATNNYLIQAANFKLNGDGIMALAGATLSTSTALIVPASTTAISSLRVPHGAAPTSPVNGDVWTTTSGLFIRINGVTKTVTLT